MLSSTLPKIGTIVNYADVFGFTPPKNKIDIIHSLCKNVLLGEIAGLNYRLKPKTSKYQDFSSEMQAKELSCFCGSNKNL